MKRINFNLAERPAPFSLFRLGSPLLLALVQLYSAVAAVKTWDGSSSGDWAVGANWSGNAAPIAGDALVGVTRTLMSNTLPAGLLLSNLTFRGSNYVLIGNSILLSSGISCEQKSNQNTISIGLTLAAPQAFQCTNGNASLLLSASLSGGLGLGTNILTIDGPGSIESSGGIGGSGGITKIGDGTLSFTGQAAEGYTGQTWVRAGLLVIDKSTLAHTLQGPVLVGDSSSLLLGELEIFNGDAIIHDQVTVQSSGLLRIVDSFFVHSLTLNGGTVIVTNAGTSNIGLLLADQVHATSVLNPLFNAITASITGPIQATSNATNLLFDVTGGLGNPDLVVSGPIGSFGFDTIIKSGSGELEFTGANIYGGAMVISGGLLKVDSAQGLSTNSVAINGGTLQLDSALITTPLQLTINSSPASPGALIATGGSNLWSGNIVLNQNAPHINVASNLVLNLSGAISGLGGLIKEGAGILKFSDTVGNTYADDTQIWAGLLQLAKTGVPAISNAAALIIGNSSDGNATDTVRYLASNQLSTKPKYLRQPHRPARFEWLYR
jgi:autotransporter-associated beta strand protein